jgi:hypothetical protein
VGTGRSRVKVVLFTVFAPLGRRILQKARPTPKPGLELLVHKLYAALEHSLYSACYIAGRFFAQQCSISCCMIGKRVVQSWFALVTQEDCSSVAVVDQTEAGGTVSVSQLPEHESASVS